MSDTETRSCISSREIVDEARSLQREGKIGEAFDLLDDALVDKPNRVLLMNELTVVTLKLAEAATTPTEIMDYYLYAAEILLNTKRTLEEEKDRISGFDQAKINTWRLEARLYQGILERRRIINKDADYPSLLNSVAELARINGDFLLANTMLIESGEANPNNAATYALAAKIAVQLENTTSALNLYNKAAKITPDHPELALTIAELSKPGQ